MSHCKEPQQNKTRLVYEGRIKQELIFINEPNHSWHWPVTYVCPSETLEAQDCCGKRVCVWGGGGAEVSVARVVPSYDRERVW